MLGVQNPIVSLFLSLWCNKNIFNPLIELQVTMRLWAPVVAKILVEEICFCF
jgi:hypothetical protein